MCGTVADRNVRQGAAAVSLFGVLPAAVSRDAASAAADCYLLIRSDLHRPSLHNQFET